MEKKSFKDSGLYNFVFYFLLGLLVAFISFMLSNSTTEVETDVLADPVTESRSL